MKRRIDDTLRGALLQVLGVYAVTAWLIWQVVGSIYEWIGLPDWVPVTALVLLLAGLPVVIATAFVQQRQRRPVERGLRRVDGLETVSDTVDTGSTRAGSSRPILTWGRAITAGVLAFALLGVAATGFVGMRSLGVGPAATLISSGQLEARAPIVLADFENRTPQEHLGQTVTEALRVELSQSPTVRVLDPSELLEPLSRMAREPGALDAALARELAVREGYSAVIAGEVSPAGSGVLLTARIEDTDGVALVRFRETASTPEEVIGAIDRLSRGIRERTGESLRSIARSRPLEQVTTGSLEALELYTRAIRAVDLDGDHPRAAVLLEEAVAMDTAFAMAHRKLANVIGQGGGSAARAAEALAAAYRHRDRLGPRERGILEGYYWSEADPERARAAYERVLEAYPDDGTALNNLATLEWTARRFDRASELFRQATKAKIGYIPYRNLVQTLFDAGQPEESKAALDEMRRMLPDNLLTDVTEMYIRSASGDLGGADSVARSMATAHPENPAAPVRGQLYRQLLLILQGRIAEAETAVQELSRMPGGLAASLYPFAQLRQAEALLLVVGDREEGLRRLQSLRTVQEDVPPLDRIYPHIAWVYARAGEAALVREVLADYRRVVPDSLRQDTGETEALIAEAEGDLAGALRFFQEEAETDPCLTCAHASIGRLQEKLDDAAAATAAYTRYLETPYHHRQDSEDYISRAMVLERLADLHEQAGRSADAARYHAELVELWREADPVLQPRVEAARRALARLTGEARP